MTYIAIFLHLWVIKLIINLFYARPEITILEGFKIQVGSS